MNYWTPEDNNPQTVLITPRTYLMVDGADYSIYFQNKESDVWSTSAATISDEDGNRVSFEATIATTKTNQYFFYIIAGVPNVDPTIRPTGNEIYRGRALGLAEQLEPIKYDMYEGKLKF